MAEKIRFTPEGEEEIEFYVIEQTTIGGVNYILVTEEESGDADAYILKDLSKPEDTEGIYEMVTEDAELDAVSTIFENLLDDVDFVREEE